jgi:hypothetical protein
MQTPRFAFVARLCHRGAASRVGPRQASSTYKWVYFEALVTAGHAMEQDEVIRSADARRTRASVDKASI